MSAAFRNFILTFVIMLVVFGFLAYKALPDINAVLFPEEEQPSETAEYSGDDYSYPEDLSREESQSPAEEQENVFSCVIAAKNDAGNICSLLYIDVSETEKTYTLCRIPVDMYVKDNNIYRLISTQLGSNNEEYMLKKLSPLVGKDIEHYIICDTASYELMVSIAEKAGSPVSISLPYPVRYLDPNFINVDDPSDEMYITIPNGSVTLTEENVAAIFNSYRDDNSVMNYDFQEGTLGQTPRRRQDRYPACRGAQVFAAVVFVRRIHSHAGGVSFGGLHKQQGQRKDPQLGKRHKNVKRRAVIASGAKKLPKTLAIHE